jgi:hypothetical protein
VIQMLFSKLLISVTSRRDMKVSLNLISIQTSVNPTGIRRAPELRRLAKLPPLRPAQLIMNIP